MGSNLSRRRRGCSIRSGFRRFDQESGASLQVAAKELHPTLRILPFTNHDIFQLVLQELFGSTLVSSIDLDKVGEQPMGFKLSGPALFQRGKQLLDRLAGVRVVREHVLDG